MVEKPAKVAALMAQWLVNGCAVKPFSIPKLPMKTHEEVSHTGVYSGTA